MSETPHHVSEKIDQVLDRLNASWDLQLPRLYGKSANLAEKDSTVNARRCSSRIRYLCYKSEIAIDNVVADFEEEAKVIFSRWVWKPSQERGTLPSTTAAESFLKRDIMSGRHRPVTTDLRKSLVHKLSSILDDEYNLTLTSESYQRITASDSVDRTSRNTSFGVMNPKAAKLSTQSNRPDQISGQSSANSASTRSKRRKASGDVEDSKRHKTRAELPCTSQSTAPIHDYYKSSKTTASTPSAKYSYSYVPEKEQQRLQQTNNAHVNLPQNIGSSFDTIATDTPSIFSETDSQRRLSSTNTSVLFEEAQESQNYFPTQEAHECLADESFTSLLDSVVTPSAVPFSFDDLNAASPFNDVEELPASLNFWLRWELYRVAQHTELSPKYLYHTMQTLSNYSPLRYEQVWEFLAFVCREQKKYLPERSDIRSWMEDSNSYQSPDGKSAYFSFKLVYNQTSGPRLWELRMNPIKIDKGNRIHRRFGSDRHAVVFLNYFDQASLPPWVTRRCDYDAEQAFHKLGQWLATQRHRIVGREWRAFYLEPEKKKTKRQTGEAPRLKLSLFAVDGQDFGRDTRNSANNHMAVAVSEFVKWHIPLDANLQSTDLKLFSRFGLGLSKTVSTVILEPHQFRYLPSQKPDMSDGCALMSTGLANAIWNICGDGGNDVPSAFQARIGGAKGLWMVDYRSNEIADNSQPLWLQVSESQLKIEPHPKDRLDADETQRCVEVLKWSTPCTPGHLNMQLINILADRGISRQKLQEIVLNDIKVYIEASKAAMTDPRLLQAWLQDYHTADRHERPVPFDFGLPEIKEEEVCFLVQSGFTAENCEFLRQGIISLMTQRLDTYVEKLRIEVPHSTTTFCVPDFYGVLEEGEVCLGFSNHWQNPRTGLMETALDGIDVLVSRNPAALASDIQKVKAVYKHELRHFKDVIIFSTKGKEPLASCLSGGDYDGDTVIVIWDPHLVDNFHNAEKPDLPTEEKCGLEKISQKLSNVFRGTLPSEIDVDVFLTSCVLFNAKPNRLGICTYEHERLIYSGANLSDPGAILLAALAGYLVDANKQGLYQSDAAWFKVRKTAQGGRKLAALAYKSGQDRPRRLPNGECVNIIDYLKFDVAMKRRDDVLIEFENLLPGAQNYDRDLSGIYNHEKNRILDLNDSEAKEASKVLKHLDAELRKVFEEWQKHTRRRGVEGDRNDLSGAIRNMSNMIGAIKPLESHCDIYRDFVRDEKLPFQHTNGEKASVKGSRWSLLRASAMYKLYSRRKITWWTVGDELGRIKARSLGSTREITPTMHHVLKADCRLIKRLLGETIATTDYADDVYE